MAKKAILICCPEDHRLSVFIDAVPENVSFTAEPLCHA
jgi:hypothetical protein